MVRYSFLVRLFRPLLYAGLSRRTKLKLAPPRQHPLLTPVSWLLLRPARI